MYHKSENKMSPESRTLNHVIAGFTAVLVGYTSSIVIVMQAASASGASPEQTVSWLLVLGITMGIASISFSWYYKMPILMAWSTPGAAILISSAGQYDLSVTIGAFIATGALIALTGAIPPLSKALKLIPPPLATAMLGAILLPFCIRAMEAFEIMPITFIAMFSAYLLGKRFWPKFSMLLLLFIAGGATLLVENPLLTSVEITTVQPIWISPAFNLSAIVNVSLPLYMVTMLSQNLPGIAMMSSYNYQAPVKPVLIGTGLANMLAAPFGGFSMNLAAISAALCMTKDVDSDKNERYKAVLWAGIFYIFAGLLASSVVALFLSIPEEITSMLAGFALLGTLLMCLQTAFTENNMKEPALLTFLITISGVSILGVSSTLWGLIAGWICLKTLRTNKSS